jgi:hypothetical protein
MALQRQRVERKWYSLCLCKWSSSRCQCLDWPAGHLGPVTSTAGVLRGLGDPDPWKAAVNGVLRAQGTSSATDRLSPTSFNCTFFFICEAPDWSLWFCDALPSFQVFLVTYCCNVEQLLAGRDWGGSQRIAAGQMRTCALVQNPGKGFLLACCILHVLFCFSIPSHVFFFYPSSPLEEVLFHIIIEIFYIILNLYIILWSIISRFTTFKLFFCQNLTLIVTRHDGNNTVDFQI